jgi:hypothetical protein
LHFQAQDLKAEDSAMKKQLPACASFDTLGLMSRRRLLVGASVTALAGYCLPWSRDASAMEAGFDYYISPTGDNNNPGTLAAPWALSALNTKRALYAGKRVGLMDGTYDVVTLLGQPSDTAWVANHISVAAGSPGSPTVIKAVNPPSVGTWNVVLNGQRGSYAGDHENGVIGPLYGNGNYVTIDGIEIRNANYQAIHAHNPANGYQIGLTVQNCHLIDQLYTTNRAVGKNSATLSCISVKNALIRNNLFENCGAPSDNNRHDFILFYGSEDCVVEYNTVTNVGAGGNCVYYKVAGPRNKRCITRFNLFDRSAASGVGTNFGILYTGSDVSTDEEEIYGNIVHGGPGRPCFSLIAAGHSGIVSVYNNTFVGDWSRDGGCNLSTGTPATVNFYNNILSRSAIGYNGDLNVAAGSALGTFDNNVYDSSPALTIIRGGAKYSTLASWQSASAKDSRSQIASSAFFVGTGSLADYYKLQSGSPAKTLGAGGTEVGAWGSGTLQIGCSFAKAGVSPVAPSLISIA